ncbi:MAG: multisubunit Na+/H+ antiporter MnhE subunit [Alteromonadaceae bacterium]|jgi:multisubunit Na+/H+ antiporter MnhE subunit
MLLFINYLSLLLSVLWLLLTPDWEPAIVTLGLIASIYAQKSKAIEQSWPRYEKMKFWIVTSLLILAFAIAKPNDEAHFGAIVTASEKDQFKTSLASFSAKFNDVCAAAASKVLANLFGPVHAVEHEYYNLGVLSLSLSSRGALSIGALGYVVFLGENFTVLTSTDGIRRYDRFLDKKAKEKSEGKRVNCTAKSNGK